MKEQEKNPDASTPTQYHSPSDVSQRATTQVKVIRLHKKVVSSQCKSG